MQAIRTLDWADLFLGRGLPKNVVSFNNSLSAAAESLAAHWIAVAETGKTDSPPAGATADDIKVRQPNTL